jgi:hypothetical protein
VEEVAVLGPEVVAVVVALEQLPDIQYPVALLLL